MATSVTVFNLNPGTALHADDRIPYCNVHDSAQSPQGSVLRISGADFFGATTRLPFSLRQALGVLTNTQPALDSTATWNDAADVFTHCKFNVTDTASDAASLLADWQVGGVSKFSVDKSGNLTIAGTVNVGSFGALTITSNSAASLVVGPNGATNPAFKVDSSTGSMAAGLKVTGAIAAGTVAIVVTSIGANANLSLNAKGSGTILIGNVSTGGVTITPATVFGGRITTNASVAAADGTEVLAQVWQGARDSTGAALNNMSLGLISTASVGTSATVITSNYKGYGLVMVIGQTSAGAVVFTDILATVYAAVAPTVLGANESGSPALRFYTSTGSGELKLRMQSGTYKIMVYSLMGGIR